MVNPDELDKSFKQSYYSCVLASYAVVANYYTKIPIKNFFEDYCKDNNIRGKSRIEEYCRKYGCPKDNNVHECIYVFHFQEECQKKLGLKIIEGLHNNSEEFSFTKSRKKFNVKFVIDVDKEKVRIEKILIKHDALLIAASKITKDESHIMIYGYDSKRNKWFKRDTALVPQGIEYEDSFFSFGKLEDGLIAIKK